MYLKKSMAENVPNLKKETYSGIGSREGPLTEMKPYRPTPRHITIKIAKVKQGILKTERKNRVIYKGI